MNYRPEYTHRWGSKTYYTQLRLDPLPPESAEALLDALVGSDTALRPLKHLLIERTEGNPFFLEESVRTLIETKVLAGDAAPIAWPNASEHSGPGDGPGGAGRSIDRLRRKRSGSSRRPRSSARMVVPDDHAVRTRMGS